MEAWSKIYQLLHPDTSSAPDISQFCGPRNDVILQTIAPWLTAEERDRYSEEKESMYRQACINDTSITHLVAGAEQFLQFLLERKIPCILVSASIKPNIDFFFQTFGLDRWLDRDLVVFDDGTYANKGEMYLEAVKRLKVNIQDCLIVEDSPSSIEYAKQLSPSCIVAVGYTAPAEKLLSCGADYYVRDLSEFDTAWLKLP